MTACTGNKFNSRKIDGADATVANINNGSYKISRPFNIAVKKGLSPVAQDFVNFIVSEDGQNIIAGNKYITLRQSSGTDSRETYTTTKAEGKVVVAGSSSVSPVMEKLIEAYKSVNPNAKIELQTSDSTTGVTNAINGIAVIVNKENPADNLTKAQVEQIFTGKVSKWRPLNRLRKMTRLSTIWSGILKLSV